MTFGEATLPRPEPSGWRCWTKAPVPVGGCHPGGVEHVLDGHAGGVPVVACTVGVLGRQGAVRLGDRTRQADCPNIQGPRKHDGVAPARSLLLGQPRGALDAKGSFLNESIWGETIPGDQLLQRRAGRSRPLGVDPLQQSTVSLLFSPENTSPRIPMRRLVPLLRRGCSRRLKCRDSARIPRSPR